ncbi:MAG: 2-octaprenyl-6-methoxyphenyl hydroxylase [Lysobacterales bacterium]|jgi:2-octaprenyl-6-methoxyphenol hydroxylase
MDRCDIVIVGGGLAGASLALALAPLGFSIAVIEAVAPRAARQPSYDDRTLALNNGTCSILRAIGLWDSLSDDATPIRQVIVSELHRPGRVVLDPAESGLTEFGHVVEARRFGVSVMQGLEQAANIEYLCPVTVSGLETGEDALTLQLETDAGARELQARLLVAADGADSFIREQMRIPTRSRDYGQTAVICNVTPEQPHEGRAFECFTPTGPFAVLPHTGGRCGMVWSVASDEAEGVLRFDDAEFLRQAQRRFGAKLGRFTQVGKRSAYPLRLVRARQDTAHRLVILGNAAHAIHPVGAQGFNLALRDAAALAEVLADADDAREDPGQAALLRQYSEWRKPDQRGTIAWSDGLTRLFANRSVLAAGVRTAGLLAHALSPSLRRRLAARYMGYQGRIPRLALGEPLSA